MPANINCTIDRINAMLRAEGMPRCEDFTRSIPGISREAQACGALERKYRMSGLDLEHIRFHMKDGRRVKMLLGERVLDLSAEYIARHMLGNPDITFSAGDPAIGEDFVTISMDIDRLLGSGGDIQVSYDPGKEPNDG